MKKKIRCILLILITIILLQHTLLITQSNAGTIDDIFKQGQDFIDKSEDGITVDETKLKNANDIIFNILYYGGMGIAVIFGAVIGIKFMMASVEEKAKIKETMLPYVIGCVVVFGAFTIWKIVVEALGTI